MLFSGAGFTLAITGITVAGASANLLSCASDCSEYGTLNALGPFFSLSVFSVCLPSRPGVHQALTAGRIRRG